MKIEFKSLPMMELRSSPGEILDRVADDGEVFIIERNGQQKACLVPVSFLLPSIPSTRISAEIDRLNKEELQHRITINEKKEIEFSFHEMAAGENVFINVILPHGYPTAAPKIFVYPVPENTPSRWEDGSIQCFGIMAVWNSKKDNVLTALSLGKRWLKAYSVWSKTGKWPKPGEV
jgi:hypothetical protein